MSVQNSAETTEVAHARSGHTAALSEQIKRETHFPFLTDHAKHLLDRFHVCDIDLSHKAVEHEDEGIAPVPST